MFFNVVKRFFVICCLLASSGSLFAQTDNSLVSGDFIVAVVGSQVVTNHEVRHLALEMQANEFNRSGKNVNLQTLLPGALEKLINDKALLDYALESKIDIDNSEIDQAEQRMAAQEQLTVDQLRRKKASEGVNREALRQELRNSLYVQKLTERSVPGRIKVTDQEIEAVIQDQQKHNTQPNIEVELAQILVSVPESASNDQIQSLQQKAQSLYSQLKRGSDFATLAKANSDSADRQNGGSLGMRPLDRYPDLFVQNIKNLEVGNITPVFRSGAGFHILKLVEKRSSNFFEITETHARHILIKLGGNMNAITARALLANYKLDILAGKASFAELAKAHSQDASAAQGGDLGWVAPGTFVPEFEQIMDKLEINEISDPLVSRFGVHLIQVLERRPGKIAEREFREMIRNNLRGKKYDDVYKDWVKEIRGQLYVEYRDNPR